jgi:hypothetical protein
MILQLVLLYYYPMKTITFKVTEDEARFMRSRAKSEKISLSEYLRRRARLQEAVSQKPQLIKCRKTGAMIFAPLEGKAPLTTQSVRELLSDFP